MKSIINWQTGKPKAEGDYLVTTLFGHVTFENSPQEVELKLVND